MLASLGTKTSRPRCLLSPEHEGVSPWLFPQSWEQVQDADSFANSYTGRNLLDESDDHST